MRKQRRYSLRYLLLAAWVIFTVSLSCWWVMFGLQQIHRLMSLDYGHANDLVRYQRMLIFEGGALLLSLFVGGGTLAYYMYRELKQGDQMRNFFLGFTHDAKTALAAVQLQAELLHERAAQKEDRDISARLLSDLERLTLQLENSLFSSNPDEGKYHFERIDVREKIEALRERFSQLTVSAPERAWVFADVRAFESMCVNLLQNSITHGSAHAVSVEASALKNGFVQLTFSDDGAGFQGDRKKLGERFYRHYGGSGSGLGLHLVRSLARSMGGAIAFPHTVKGFKVAVALRGGTV